MPGADPAWPRRTVLARAGVGAPVLPEIRGRAWPAAFRLPRSLRLAWQQATPTCFLIQNLGARPGHGLGGRTSSAGQASWDHVSAQSDGHTGTSSSRRVRAAETMLWSPSPLSDAHSRPAAGCVRERHPREAPFPPPPRRARLVPEAPLAAAVPAGPERPRVQGVSCVCCSDGPAGGGWLVAPPSDFPAGRANAAHSTAVSCASPPATPVALFGDSELPEGRGVGPLRPMGRGRRPWGPAPSRALAAPGAAQMAPRTRSRTGVTCVSRTPGWRGWGGSVLIFHTTVPRGMGLPPEFSSSGPCAHPANEAAGRTPFPETRLAARLRRLPPLRCPPPSRPLASVLLYGEPRSARS